MNERWQMKTIFDFVPINMRRVNGRGKGRVNSFIKKERKL